MASPSAASWPVCRYDANPEPPVNDMRFHEIGQSMTYFVSPVGDIQVMSGTRRKPLPKPRRRSSQYTSSARTRCMPHSRRYCTSKLTRQLCANVFRCCCCCSPSSSCCSRFPTAAATVAAHPQSFSHRLSVYPLLLLSPLTHKASHIALAFTYCCYRQACSWYLI